MGCCLSSVILPQSLNDVILSLQARNNGAMVKFIPDDKMEEVIFNLPRKISSIGRITYSNVTLSQLYPVGSAIFFRSNLPPHSITLPDYSNVMEVTDEYLIASDTKGRKYKLTREYVLHFFHSTANPWLISTRESMAPLKGSVEIQQGISIHLKSIHPDYALLQSYYLPSNYENIPGGILEYAIPKGLYLIGGTVLIRFE